MQNMFPLAGVRPPYCNLMWKSGIKANICAEVKAVLFIYASGQIGTQLMWKLISADWHFEWQGAGDVYDSPSAQEIPGEKRAEIPITHLSRQQEETASNRESAVVSSLQSQRQREFDFETRRQAERQKWWQR